MHDGGPYFFQYLSKIRHELHVTISDNLAAWLQSFPPPLTSRNFGRMLTEVKQPFKITHAEARHSFISYHVAAYRSLGDAALQAGNSESIIKRHYLNLHPREEGGQFFRIVTDPKRRRVVLAPKEGGNPTPPLTSSPYNRMNSHLDALTRCVIIPLT